MSGAISEVRAIATLEALDGLRSRRQLVVRALTPIVLFVCVAAITIALRGADAANHPQAYRVAVQGDYEGARATLAGLNPGRLEFHAVADARLATIDGADAGLIVPDGLDVALSQPTGDAVPIEIVQITLDASSRAAATLLQSAFVEAHASQVRGRIAAVGADDGRAPTSSGSFSVEATNVDRTVAGTRSLTSQVIPGLVCLQAALLITGTANRIVSRRTRGLLMTQLLLPISRRGLTLAKGLGELVIGLVTAAPFVAAVLIFGAFATTQDSSVATVVGQSVATVVAMLALFAFTTVTGIWIGTAARTQEQVALATGAAVIFAALVATTVALSTFRPPAALAIIPFAGLVGELRLTLNGEGLALAFVVSVASTLVGTFAIIVIGGRSLDAERLVLRNG